ncbi:MAG: hypothetical protein OEU46_11490 [Alphaproteobacteria bacterium]|nr:hypothetical protein [Alphaproteobacteria bacterium]
MVKRDDPAAARGAKSGQRMKHDDVVRLVGDLEDAKVAEILAIAPTLEELEEAVAWAEAESDVMGESGKSLSGAAARVYEILMTRKDFGEDERPC